MNVIGTYWAIRHKTTKKFLLKGDSIIKPPSKYNRLPQLFTREQDAKSRLTFLYKHYAAYIFNENLEIVKVVLTPLQDELQLDLFGQQEQT